MIKVKIKNFFRHTLFLLCLVLVVKGIIACWLIVNSGVQLSPDEAQYWTWSCNLDWGYYSKPPGIAWQIWLTTYIFGDTLLGIRFGAVLLAMVLSLLVYWLASCCGANRKTCFWSAMIMALCPAGIMASFAATTDAGFMVFWVVSMALVAKALRGKQRPNYWLIGVFVACGALFKWTIYAFWPLVLLGMIFIPLLRDKKVIGGIILSLLGLLPSIVWNAQHGWVTFDHVFGHNIVGHDRFTGNFWDFLGAQAGILSPILFIVLIFSFIWLLRRRHSIEKQWLFCGGSALLLLAVALVLSTFKKMQPNWMIYAYPTAVVFLCWYANVQLRWGMLWVKLGVALSVVLCGLLIAVPWFQESDTEFLGNKIPFKLNPFRQCMGWDNLEYALKAMDYDQEKDFLFSDKYQMVSILSFYNPDKERAYFIYLDGGQSNQFDFWSQMRDLEVHKDGYFVITEIVSDPRKMIMDQYEYYKSLLWPYFEDVSLGGAFVLYRCYKEPAKCALVLKCYNYNGD